MIVPLRVFVFVLRFSCFCRALCASCLSLPHFHRHDLFFLPLLLCSPFNHAKLTLCRVRVHPRGLFRLWPRSGRSSSVTWQTPLLGQTLQMLQTHAYTSVTSATLRLLLHFCLCIACVSFLVSAFLLGHEQLSSHYSTYFLVSPFVWFVLAWCPVTPSIHPHPISSITWCIYGSSTFLFFMLGWFYYYY